LNTFVVTYIPAEFGSFGLMTKSMICCDLLWMFINCCLFFLWLRCCTSPTFEKPNLCWCQLIFS
jgi:hypothetical protein